jgi:hypothetical protein
MASYEDGRSDSSYQRAQACAWKPNRGRLVALFSFLKFVYQLADSLIRPLRLSKPEAMALGVPP